VQALLIEIERFEGVREGATVQGDAESIGSLAAHALRRRWGNLTVDDGIELTLDDLTGIDIFGVLRIVQAIATELDHQILFQPPRGEGLALCPPGKSAGEPPGR
jgi:hypothetical protein